MKNLIIKKDVLIEYFGLIFGFIFSCFNGVSVSIWLLIYMIKIFYTKNKISAINFLILLHLRSVINHAVGCSMNVYMPNAKLICVFMISMFLIYTCNDLLNKKIYDLIKVLLIFGLYLVVSGLFFSSYPLLVCFKIITYLIPFIAIIEGIYVTRNENWIHKINILFALFTFSGFLVVNNNIGYLRNGYSFQGFFNHPNVLGIMVVIFVAGYVYEKNNSPKKISYFIVLFLCLIQIYLSNSRTSLFAFICMMIIAVYSLNISMKNKIFIFLFFLLVIICFFYFNDEWKQNFWEFILKGGENAEEITRSRDYQFSKNLKRFYSNPLFGTGLNTPYLENVKSFSLLDNYVVENGNIFLALIADIGIIGMIIFIICYTKIYFIGKGNKSGYAIFFVGFLVSLGEMIFFSTNGSAIILYLYYAIYMSDNMIDRREV